MVTNAAKELRGRGGEAVRGGCRMDRCEPPFPQTSSPPALPRCKSDCGGAPCSTHSPGVQVERDALLVAVQDLLQVAVREEDAALQERVRGLASQLLHTVHVRLRGIQREGG